MRVVLACLMLVMLSGISAAQITIPAFSRTFSSATLTRGLLFKAPTNFVITGIQVPDEAKAGTQHAAIYTLATQPPSYPTASPVTTPDAYVTGPSANILPTNVACRSGEWIGVLGACGDTTSMKSSYGSSGPFASAVLGQTISITRFISQTNIASNKGVAALSESTGSVGRVNVYVAGITGDTATPAPGGTVKYSLQSDLDNGLLYQLALSFGNGPIPIDNRQIELSPDGLFFITVQNFVPALLSGSSGTLDAKGMASAALNIPNIAVLKGSKISAAFVTIKNGAPSNIMTITLPFIVTIT